MSLISAARVRRDTAKLFRALGVDRDFETTEEEQIADSMGLDPLPVVGPTIPFSGAVTSLRSEGRTDKWSVTVIGDIRERLGVRPGNTVWVKDVTPGGVAIAGGLPVKILEGPQGAELAMRDGVAFTVLHLEQGAPT